MEKQAIICRFCFEKCDGNFKVKEASTHESLIMLLITMDQAICDEPMMCTDCWEILQNCFVFKKICLDARTRTVAASNDKSNGYAACEFCMNTLGNCSFTMLDIEENIPKKAMLEKYFPELDLNDRKKLVICGVCCGSLVNFSSFITTCSIVEEKIKEYRQAEGVNTTDPIKLNSVLQFAAESIWKEKNNKVDVFKMEDTICVKSESEEMVIPEGICTLCLEKCDDFKAVDESRKNSLKLLLPKIDFTVMEGPVMCKNCEEVLMECFDFKAMCLRTHSCIVSFLKDSSHVKLDLKDVYLSRNVTRPGVPEDQSICGFCMNLVKNCSAVCLDVEGNVILEEMTEQCLPELDLSIIKKPIICASCHGSLKDCFRFVKNCLTIREDIRKYCETSDINNKGQTEISDSLQFTMRNLITRGVDDNLVDINDVEPFCEDRKNCNEREVGDGGDTIKLEQIFLDDSKNAIKDVEIKNKSFTEINDPEINNESRLTPKNAFSCAGVNKLGCSIKEEEEIFCEENETKLKEKILVEMKDHNFLFNEEIEIKTDEPNFNRFQNDIVLPHSEVTRRLHRDECLMLNLERDQSSPNVKHTSLTKKRDSKIRMYQNKLHLFKTKHRNSLVNHTLILEDFKKNLLVHKALSKVTIYKCDFCSFETKRKFNLKRHLLTHKDPLEVTMYKCGSCSFQSKRKRNLSDHLLLHKDPSEVTIYKCDHCSWQTKYKYAVKKHLLSHENSSQLTMFTCYHCSWQTKYKNSLKDHLLLHKDPSEVTMYQCDSCLFRSKHKNVVKKHIISHKNSSELTMYKCDHCSWQTKYKLSLKQHLLLHKDPPEVMMYKCSSCSFQTKSKCNLKNHLLLHKDPSELTMYKCGSCSFQSKCKRNVKNHLLVHKDPSEVTMYKCDHCSWQTKYKSAVKKHLISHKNSSESTMYTCYHCSWQTKYKHSLKDHMLLHKDPSEVTMYQCDSCSFRTKHKSAVKKHLISHKNSLE